MFSISLRKSALVVALPMILAIPALNVLAEDDGNSAAYEMAETPVETDDGTGAAEYEASPVEAIVDGTGVEMEPSPVGAVVDEMEIEPEPSPVGAVVCEPGTLLDELDAADMRLCELQAERGERTELLAQLKERWVRGYAVRTIRMYNLEWLNLKAGEFKDRVFQAIEAARTPLNLSYPEFSGVDLTVYAPLDGIDAVMQSLRDAIDECRLDDAMAHLGEVYTRLNSVSGPGRNEMQKQLELALNFMNQADQKAFELQLLFSFDAME